MWSRLKDFFVLSSVQCNANETVLSNVLADVDNIFVL